MTLNDYMALQKRSQVVSNTLSVLLGVAVTLIAGLLFVINQQPVNAMQDQTSSYGDSSYELYAQAFSQGYLASTEAKTTEKTDTATTQTTASGCSEAAAHSTGATSHSYSAAPMSKVAWEKTVNNAYNTYSTSTVGYTENVDSFNSTNTHNSSTNSVNVTDSDGAVVSTNTATNGQISSNTQVHNNESLNTHINTTDSYNDNSHDISTTHTTGTINTNNTNNTNHTMNVQDSYNEVAVHHIQTPEYQMIH